MFQSQVAILGWGYQPNGTTGGDLKLFQSQVAILGWGYTAFGASVQIRLVSIAGGDSWVGIR